MNDAGSSGTGLHRSLFIVHRSSKMLKNLYKVLILTLALNFLAVAGGIGWLWYDGRLNKEQVAKIKDLLYPKPEEVKTESAEEESTTQPANQLEALLAKASGRTAAEQVAFIQQSFDSQLAQLDRRQREIADMQRQVELAKQQLAADRAKLEKGEQALVTEQQLQQKLASDKGFQDSLSLYQTLSGKQVKTIFMGLDDETVVRYLQAMPPRASAKIVKEFKTPEENERVQRILERMRQSQPQTPPPQPETLPPSADSKEKPIARPGQEGQRATAGS
jgi:hypothetical protein